MFIVLLFSIANVYRLHNTTKQKDSFFLISSINLLQKNA